MKAFILKRAILLFPLLLGITFITFCLTKALPGDPVFSMVGERASPETIEKIRKEIGSDRGILLQYAGYVNLLLRGEMGRSYYTNRNVAEDIRQKFPNTMRLAVSAMIAAVPLGILLGFVSALRKDDLVDKTISAFSIACVSIPVFWSGLMLMLFFALSLKWLPPSGTGDVRYLVLPAIALSLPAIGTLTRVTRITILDLLHMPFIRTAHAKGLKESRVRALHVLKNAMIPIVTVIGLDFGSYLNGAVLTETIFGWDGIGRFTMEGIIKRDYPVIMGCIITGTVVFVVINLVVDILYFYMDPRVRLHGKGR